MTINPDESVDSTHDYTADIRVGKLIGRLRKEAGATQIHLAEAISTKGILEVNNGAISAIERGTRRLRFDEALAICEIFDISPYRLAAGEETALPKVRPNDNPLLKKGSTA